MARCGQLASRARFDPVSVAPPAGGARFARETGRITWPVLRKYAGLFSNPAMKTPSFFESTFWIGFARRRCRLALPVTMIGAVARGGEGPARKVNVAFDLADDLKYGYVAIGHDARKALRPDFPRKTRFFGRSGSLGVVR